MPEIGSDRTVQLNVRIPADLHADLTRRALVEERFVGRVVARALRAYLYGGQEENGGTSPPEGTRKPDPRPQETEERVPDVPAAPAGKGERRGSVASGSGGAGPVARPDPRDCAHPVGRRIGDQCGVCGKKLRR